MDAITKSFGGVKVLHGATLEIAPAEVMALVGQNGAGKSTMIKILNGAHSHDGGTISFGGQPWQASSPQQAQRLGVSTIFQELNLIGYRSVAENIFLGREPKRGRLFIDWKAMNGQARQLLARFEVKVDVTRPLGEFPTAIQQMVAIARAVSFKARLVIMDEPTSSLDEAEVAVLLRTIRQLRDDGVSVLFVTHKLDELYAVCDRVTIMRDGRTVAVSAMQDMPKLTLVSSMLGKALAEVMTSGSAAERGEGPSRRDELLGVRSLAVGRRVADASLSIDKGEIVGLAGLLGSGRTETARAIFAADRRAKGEIAFNGMATKFRTPAEAIKAGMGFCSEDRKVEGIIPDMSVADNLTLALMPALSRGGRFDLAEQRRIVERFIKEIGIKCSSPDQKIRELSGGNQQKVLLARWLCMNPKLLILDEPTRGIDVGAKAEILNLIRRFSKDGLGVLVISSELEEIIEAASRVFVLRDGLSVAELRPPEISEDAIMAAMAHGTSPAAEETENSAHA